MLPKKRLSQGVERFRRQFGDQPGRSLGALLPSEDIQKLVAEEVGSFRERIYPPLTTLGLFSRPCKTPASRINTGFLAESSLPNSPKKR